MARISRTLEFALNYWHRGWSIFPVHSKSKKAAVRWKKLGTERASEAQIEDWFQDESRGIGVIFGACSGNLVCRDFDDIDVYHQWTEKHPELARKLPTVDTARGRHVYATASPEHTADLRALIMKPDATGPIIVAGGELRIGACYTVLPPSIHNTGHEYRWLISLPDKPLPELDLISSDFFMPVQKPKPTSKQSSGIPPSCPPKGRRDFPTTTALGENPCNREHRDYREEQSLQTNTEAMSSDSGSKQKQENTKITRRAEAIELAIADSIPEGPGKRHRQVFELARGLKAIPELSDANPQELKKYVRQWHKRSFERINTKPFEETWIDFLKGWPKVRFPKGEEPMVEMFQRASCAELPEVATEYDQQALKLLVALCRELQRSAGERQFFLSCRTAGRLLGVDHTTANRWLFLLTSDGVLKKVTPGERGKRIAARYRYLGEM